MLLGSDILRLFSLDPIFLLASLLGVWCWLPLRSSTPTSAACLSALLWPTGQLWSLPLSGPCRQLSFSGPLTTSGYGEISCPRILCLVSRQNRQLNRLLWQPTPIVLHDIKYSNLFSWRYMIASIPIYFHEGIWYHVFQSIWLTGTASSSPSGYRKIRIKLCFTFPRTLELQPYHQILFTDILTTLLYGLDFITLHRIMW